MTLLVFPPFSKNLGYDWVKRLKNSNSVQPHVSGREVRIGYWEFPLWEWDLIFDVLRDGGTVGTDPDALKKLLGFYLANAGSLTPFVFQDPDDWYVKGQLLGTGDGVNSTFLFVRTYGYAPAGYIGTEPVGYVDFQSALGVPFVVYVDGVAQTLTADYTLDGTPVAMKVIFNVVPGSGQVVTCDMAYWYWVRFQSDTQEFVKFSSTFWAVKKLTLQSLRD
jgi:uncharacterized protein (TIGR02217 family)